MDKKRFGDGGSLKYRAGGRDSLDGSVVRGWRWEGVRGKCLSMAAKVKGAFLALSRYSLLLQQ